MAARFGDDECLPFGQLPDFGAGEDRDVFSADAAAAVFAVVVGGAGDADVSEEVGDFLVERDVFAAAEHD